MASPDFARIAAHAASRISSLAVRISGQSRISVVSAALPSWLAEGVEVRGLGRGHGAAPGGVVDDEHMNALFSPEAKRFINLLSAPGVA
jgi:hypothetical protein